MQPRGDLTGSLSGDADNDDYVVSLVTTETSSSYSHLCRGTWKWRDISTISWGRHFSIRGELWGLALGP